ncbi:MAG: aminotransferase class I/II-fold pyridoxal phosphate-dependent enzyme [Rhodobacter sp.]|nr:aminotransferase class I/II-fold pyridoxal phosphate-dependent enzyme [Rhodobacter sp.]
MKLSKRITGLTGGGSDGWDVFNRARAMIAAGTPVIELTQGEHDIRTAPAILDEMHRVAKAGNTGYSPVHGTPALRDAIAARVTARTGVPTTRDNVAITPGGQPALFASHSTACDPGDTALFIDPYYATYPGTIRGVGAVPRAVAARPDHGFQPLEADIAAAADGARSLLINTPNNPTGVVYTEATLTGIARACRDHDLWLISDEVYDTQVWTGTHLSPRALPGMADRTLVIGSMSKSHAMTGSRVGWVVGPAEAIRHLVNLSTHTTYGVPGFIQDAALFALNQGPALEAQVAAPFLRRRAIAAGVLNGVNAVTSVPCDGAMYVMLDIRATAMTGEAFANALLDAEKIAVMPGESFGRAAAGHLRVAMTVDDATFEDALRRLVAFAEARLAGKPVEISA